MDAIMITGGQGFTGRHILSFRGPFDGTAARRDLGYEPE